MTHTLAAAQPVFLMSLAKPVIMAVTVIAWAYLAKVLDKDAEITYLPRRMFNGIQLGAAALAILIWLMVPIFWVGWPLAVIIMLAAAIGYVQYRNAKVPEQQKWEFSTQFISDILQQRQADAALRSATLRLVNSNGEMTDVLTRDNPNYEPYQVIEQILEFALPRNGERVDLMISKDKVALAVQVDGVSYPLAKPEQAVAVRLVDFVKQLAGLDVEDKRSKQTGSFTARAGEEGEHHLLVTTSASTRSINLKIMIDPENRMQPEYKSIGLIDAQRKQLQPIMESDTGVVLFTGPARQGISTTMYSVVQEHDPYTLGVVTLEDVMLEELEGVHHNQIEPGTSPDDIANRIAVMIRRDPNIFMLSQMYSPKVPPIIAEAGQEIRFYVGVNQPDTFTALKAWVKSVGDKRLAANSLSAIVSQRLIRKLCQTCRLAYKPDPALIKKLNLPKDAVAQLYKKSGQVIVKDKPVQCPTCHGMGFMGRTGVFEIMILDDAARKLIRADDYDTLRSHLRKNKMMWMQEAALQKAAAGITGISEVTRALAKEKK